MLSVLLIAVYFFTYCIAFAGIGILAFMRGQLRLLAFRAYLPFFSAYLAYVLVKNSAFFISVFLKRPEYLGGPWYSLLDCLSTAALLMAFQRFSLGLSKATRFPRLPEALGFLPFAPLALAFAWICAETASGPKPGLRQALHAADSIIFLLVFAVSTARMLSRRIRSASRSRNFAVRCFAIGNAAFLPIFAVQALYNLGPRGPLAPLCAENLYFAGMNLATIGILARRVLSAREAGGDKEDIRLNGMELEIIARIRRGMTNKEIAYQLGVSEYVVKNGVHRILKKTKARNRVELLRAWEADEGFALAPGGSGAQPHLKALGAS